MSLELYRQKRDFDRTPEPPPDEPEAGPAGGGPLRFFVQKHDASRLHYDFRLELDGVLKSWAVPKGPSLNPADKRLAVMVEDHPLDYGNFEGIIPANNYGAGTVMLWDEGTYHAPDTLTRAESEATLREGLARGRLKFALQGEKLKGEYSLSRMKGEDNKNWLLIKKRDAFATGQDVTLWDRSVKSGRTLAQIAGSDPPVWTGAGISNPPSAADPPATNVVAPVNADLDALPIVEMPHNVQPMLAGLADAPFDRPGWLFEIKWDGYRAIAEVQDGEGPQVRLYSRNDLDFTARYPEVVADLGQLGIEAVLDGEVVVLDAQGRPQFRLLQYYLQDPQAGVLVYFVFDILYLAGHDLTHLPLHRRKALLAQIVPALPHVRLSDHIEGQGVAMFDAARKNGLEGIIAKDGGSIYQPGKRTAGWLKIKTATRQEAVIAGYTEPPEGRTELGALILGLYEGDAFIYIGHSGTGFDAAELARLCRRMQPLITEESPFATTPPTNAPPVWVRPELVCEIKFAGWTSDGLMRQAVYMGLRDDVDPRTVVRETPAPPARKSFIPRYQPQREEVDEMEIDGQQVEVTHPSRVLWPEDGLTKQDMVAYYRAVAPTILPYLKDRPLSVRRFPDGIRGEGFYQKDFRKQSPPWIEVRDLNLPDIEQDSALLCQDEATLVYLANLGAIELHPWHSRMGSLDRPDYVVLDLDPLEVPFGTVIKVARTAHDVLDAAKIPAYPKTSGGDGLHIFVPLGAQYSYDQATEFITIVAHLINERLPDLTSLERSPEKRCGKVYLDCLQNSLSKSVIAAYSLRARRHAPAAAPLLWPEVRPGLTPLTFTLGSLPKRIADVGDVWGPVLGPGIDMAAALERLEALARGK